MVATAWRILVTLDGSALAAAAIPMAAKLASDLGAEVILLRVVEGRWWGRPRGADALPVGVEVEKREADDELRALVPAFPGLQVTCVVLAGTYAAVEIINWLRQQVHPVDFIVMATHGRGGLRRLIAGSVTEAVLRTGLAPVIAVRPPARPAPVLAALEPRRATGAPASR
jgi:nucleotide-binding universal stress UspA family protein